jgi:hypothetical protein
MTCNPAFAIASDGADWRAVSPKRPCPICGSSSACQVHGEQSFASCANHQSEWPLTTGAWLHKLQPVPSLEVVAEAAAVLSVGLHP